MENTENQEKMSEHEFVSELIDTFKVAFNKPIPENMSEQEFIMRLHSINPRLFVLLMDVNDIRRNSIQYVIPKSFYATESV